MKYGDQGEAVRRLQCDLVRLGCQLPRYGVDGVFGTETWRAVRQRSRDVGIREPVPGEVDAELVALIHAAADHVRQLEASPLLVELVDVSGWQAPSMVDVNAARDWGLAGVIVKASDGMSAKSSSIGHVAWAREVGCPIGIYHYADLRSPALRRAPAEQARVMLEQAERAGWGRAGDLIPWLDAEWQSYRSRARRLTQLAIQAARRRLGRDLTPEERSSCTVSASAARVADLGVGARRFPPTAVITWIRQWVQAVEDAIGVTPGLYTQHSWWLHRLASTPAFGGLPLWQAHGHGDGITAPDPGDAPTDMLRGWPEGPALWQWAGNSGRVPWYAEGGSRTSGAIDRDLCLVDLRTLQLEGGVRWTER